MEERLFFELLDRFVVDARLEFLLGERRVRVGGNKDSAPAAVVRIRNPRFFKRVLAYGNLGMGEAFMDRDFEMEEGSLTEFLTVLVRNRLDHHLAEALSPSLAGRLLWIRLTNRLRGRRGNIATHYDNEDDSLFETFLDPRLVYSCGYVTDRQSGIEQFQLDKLKRVCDKLRLEPGERLVDIGCGYGGLLIYAAQTYGVSGKGITLGRRHCERATANVAAAGLTDRIEIELLPYEKLTGSFDKLVSVGMMEHLRRSEYRRFIDVVSRLLTEKGIGLFQYIGCTGPKNDNDPFIQKYILPGSNQPKLSEFVAELEDHDMAVLDVENLVRHYAFTLKEWTRNFERNSPQLDADLFDDRFKRMWQYYLECAAAAAFASAGALYQILFARNYPPPMPLQRV
ncbi:MAG: class I SAM-dependent methyltransferase [Acidobacteriota bacterium]